MPPWIPAPPPKTPLGRYRVLSSRAGVRVSPIQLGGLSIGDKWEKRGLGAMDKGCSFRLLDAYFDAGGNFVDTANNYQDGTSEAFIGEWAEARGIRDQLVIATKYSLNYKSGEEDADVPVKINYCGNNAKSLRLSVEASLKKLRTDYIDILYVHYWDFNTSISEVMDALHQLVLAGKVLYLGVSATPAWVVAQANEYAVQQGKTPFVIYQGAWNVMERSFERDIIPMARAHGMALAPFNVLAGGKLRTDAEEAAREASGERGRTFASPEWKRNEGEKRMCTVLEKVVRELGRGDIRAVAIAYVLQKAPNVFPIVGGRKVEHLMANIEALNIGLSEQQVKDIESVVPLDLGFPMAIIGDGASQPQHMLDAGIEDKWPSKQPIKPKTSTRA